MKNFMALILLLIPLQIQTGNQPFPEVMFWNLENFFYPGSPDAPRFWSRKRFQRKCQGISKTILEVSDSCGRLPGIIGLCEVGDRRPLKRLLDDTPLRKTSYRIVHRDSPDHRGIDCALLYDSSVLTLREQAFFGVLDSAGAVIPTREMVMARFDNLIVIVNHHPSKLGGGATGRRRAVFGRMEAIADSLVLKHGLPVICIGDFNDTLWGDDAQGSIKFDGKWERIDGAFLYGPGSISTKVFASPDLLEKDSSHSGYKPRRTFIGPRYNGGLSDHLPVVCTLSADCVQY